MILAVDEQAAHEHELAAWEAFYGVRDHSHGSYSTLVPAQSIAIAASLTFRRALRSFHITPLFRSDVGNLYIRYLSFCPSPCLYVHIISSRSHVVNRFSCSVYADMLMHFYTLSSHLDRFTRSLPRENSRVPLTLCCGCSQACQCAIRRQHRPDILANESPLGRLAPS